MTPHSDGMSVLRHLLDSGGFRFDLLRIEGIRNAPVIARFGIAMRDQETCLFHRDVGSGDAYVERLRDRVVSGMRDRLGVPVVRFADGEYAFYRESLECNGLYAQAESVRAIRESIPAHAEDLRYVAGKGLLAPLVHPGNATPKRRAIPLIRKAKGDDSGARFLEFLDRHEVTLAGHNYVPFYVVYAYLTSTQFASDVDGKTVCVLNSDIDVTAIAEWYSRRGSRPKIVPVPIPAACVATRWPLMREEALKRVPADAALCLVGAGIGALSVCADVARRVSIPALDAGHALNLMNGLEAKSGGARLYTIHG